MKVNSLKSQDLHSVSDISDFISISILFEIDFPLIVVVKTLSIYISYGFE